MVPFLTYHERAAITKAMKEMCVIQDSDLVGTHREADQRGWRVHNKILINK